MDDAVRLAEVGRRHRRLVAAAARQQDRAAAFRRDQLLPAGGREHRPASPLGDLRGQVGGGQPARDDMMVRSEEHTSELQSLMRISSAFFCLKKKKKNQDNITNICIRYFFT